MAELTFKDGRTKFVGYNTAAMVFQATKGNFDTIPPKDHAKFRKIAKQIATIDFEKQER